jgi:hypothetical protein
VGYGDDIQRLGVVVVSEERREGKMFEELMLETP